MPSRIQAETTCQEGVRWHTISIADPPALVVSLSAGKPDLPVNERADQMSKAEDAQVVAGKIKE